MAPDEVRVGCWLSSEEHAAPDLVALAVAAERAGFPTAMLSDHFHPWTPTQGQSSFSWTTLGAIAAATTTLEVGTGVAAAVHRMHPVVLAQAAATVAALMPGRFFLGLGTGERLNEHVTGQPWPRAGDRRAMLVEAIQVVRRLWEGANVNHRGDWFTVENAQLFGLPGELPPILVSASGRRSAAVAGEQGDGLIAVAPDPSLVDAYEAAGGKGRRVGQLHVCVAPTVEAARATALRHWPNGAVRGEALTDLARPEDFAALAALVDEDDMAAAVVCGPDPEVHLAAVRRWVGAGFDDVYVHQVGPDQQAMLDLYADHVVPRL